MPPDTDIACDIVLAYHPPALRWVPTAIDSALNQQNARCIVHVIADAVDPSDQRHIRDLFRDAPNIRFHSNETAIGPYRSLHKVFKHFETDHIAIQDSDDISLPHRIWYSVNALRQHDCDIFAGSIENFVHWQSEGDKSIKKFLDEHRRVEHPGSKLKYCPNGKVLNPAMLMTKRVFEDLNGFADWFCSADNEFSERALSAGKHIHFDESVVVLRRLHAKSLCQDDEYGILSDKRAEYIRELHRRIGVYATTFDPKRFGALDSHA